MTTQANDPLREMREWLIRVILWSLGLAAVMGVLSVLTGMYDVGIRVAMTAVLTAMAAGVLWSAGSVDVQLRRARQIGLVVTLLTYGLLLLALWDVGPTEEFAMTALFTGGLGTVAFLGAVLAAVEKTRLTGQVTLAACAVLWVTGVLEVWTGAFWWIRGSGFVEIWVTLAVFSALAALCLINVRFSATDWWRWAGVAACVVGFAGGVVLSVRSGSAATAITGDVIEHICIGAASVAVLAAHANLLLLENFGGRYRWLPWGTIAAAAVATCGFDLMLLFDRSSPEILERLTAAAAILSGVGSLAVVVLAMYFRKEDRDVSPMATPFLKSIEEIRQVTLECPRCHQRQSLELGSAPCSDCGLQIDITLHERR